MGFQEWVRVISDCGLKTKLTVDRVIALGYEEEFGKYRRIVQHAL